MNRKNTKDHAVRFPDFQRDESSRIRVITLFDKGQLFNCLGQYQPALAAFEAAGQICRDLPDKSAEIARLLSWALASQGTAWLELGNPAEALPCYEEAIQVLAELSPEERAQAARDLVLTTIDKGRALMILGRNQEAQLCFEDAIVKLEDDKNKRELASAWMSLGELDLRQGFYPKSLVSLEEAVSLWKRVTAFEVAAAKSDYAYTLFCLADAFDKLGRHTEALATCEQALVLSRAIFAHLNNAEERANLSATWLLRGTILRQLGREPEARECFRESEKLETSET